METLIERGCGLDVHKKTVAACVRVPGSKGGMSSIVRKRSFLDSEGAHRVGGRRKTSTCWGRR
jgi:hypothetical protein